MILHCANRNLRPFDTSKSQGLFSGVSFQHDLRRNLPLQLPRLSLPFDSSKIVSSTHLYTLNISRAGHLWKNVATHESKHPSPLHTKSIRFYSEKSDSNYQPLSSLCKNSHLGHKRAVIDLCLFYRYYRVGFIIPACASPLRQTRSSKNSHYFPIRPFFFSIPKI